MNLQRIFIGFFLILLSVGSILFVGFSKIPSETTQLLIIIAGMGAIGSLLSFQKVIESEDSSNIKIDIFTENLARDQTLYGNAGKLLTEVNIIRNEEPLGLVESIFNANKYDYSPLILESQTLQIVLNDGRGWISRHSGALKKRFEDSSKQTTFFLLHPQSTMIRVLAQKVGIREGIEELQVDELRRKIIDTVELLEQIRLPSTDLKIYGHFLYNPYSLFLGDEYAIVTPYFISRMRQYTPLFKFQDRLNQESYYKELKEDIEALKYDAEEISHKF